MDDLLAPDGGTAAKRWKRDHNKPALSVQPAKRAICIHFPVPMFFRIRRMAKINGLAFTAQVVKLCADALEKPDV